MTMDEISRRGFLRAAGVVLGLPLFESLPASIFSNPIKMRGAPRRMVCIGNMLGFYPQAFWPQQDGRSYSMPATMKPLEPHRQHMTVISGLDHGIKGGHFAIHAFLSGVHYADAKSMPDGNISVDQRAAESVGGQTRFPSLTVGSESGIHGGCQMCWTRSGTRVPPITGPRDLFRKLFVTDGQAGRKQAVDRFRMKHSILDAVNNDAKGLGRELGARDREKLDEYLTSVRDVESRLDLAEHWVDVPKPKPPLNEPANENMVNDLPLLYELMALAIQTDSSRVVTLEIGGDFQAQHFGYNQGYHRLSHHGQVQASIDALMKIERYQIEKFNQFLSRLAATDEGEGSLLDHTTVLFGSGMGNANAHTNSNLPIILAGGGFRHGQHLAFKREDRSRPPMSNLFVSMLQQFGLETDQFAHGTSTLRGLEVKA